MINAMHLLFTKHILKPEVICSLYDANICT